VSATGDQHEIGHEGGDAQALLLRWRERLLAGVVTTCLFALIPPFAIQLWQWRRNVPGILPGMQLCVAAWLALFAFSRWRVAFRMRAAVFMVMAFALVASSIVAEGLAPAHFAAVCTLCTLGVLLYSRAVAYVLLAGSAAAMAVAAVLYHAHWLTPLSAQRLDVHVPMNWLRVGLFAIFPSALAAIAVGYLLDKLQQTLTVRGQLVARLKDEVAQRERALNELEAAQARLVQAQKLEAIGQLAAGIAHDFNNTLSVIQMEAELLLRRPREADSVVRGAEAMLSAAERGSQLARQLLLWNRAEAARRPVIDAVRTFEDCVRALTRLLPSEITFQVQIAPAPLAVSILPSELQQIVLNLGINARDAMLGGGTLALGLEQRALAPEAAQRLGVTAGRYAVLNCRDTGPGMDSATLARVFEPFFTTKDPGRGTGLGLTNVWNIARRVAGCVQVESAEGVGTRVAVFLPLSEAPLSTRDDSTPLPVAGRRETVLVVEDDIRLRALLVTSLSDAGYVVLDAPSVDAAIHLERAHPGPIDLVCTDVVMPGRPARELLAELRTRHPEAGVLVCSGYSEDEQIARGIQSGEYKHLGKPFTRSALLAAVRGAIERA
jgi:two-component system cell cycle sensor histidine kinase/response regulator CckA